MPSEISITDHTDILNAAFEMCYSYDSKNWDRLRKCLAPSIRLDFRSLQGELHENLTPDEYVAILSGPNLLGDKRVKTQHLLGGGKWEFLDDGAVHVLWQLRVKHVRHDDENLTNVVNKGHGYGLTQHHYRKIAGVWKIEGNVPQCDWTEYDLYGTLSPPQKNGV